MVISEKRRVGFVEDQWEGVRTIEDNEGLPIPVAFNFLKPKSARY